MYIVQAECVRILYINKPFEWKIYVQLCIKYIRFLDSTKLSLELDQPVAFVPLKMELSNFHHFQKK